MRGELSYEEEGEFSLEGEAALQQILSGLERELEMELEFEQAPACPASTLETISCFSRYQNTIESLPQSERTKLEKIATRIVNSRQPGSVAINRVVLVGHADQDAERERRQPGYLDTISRERAVAVRQRLKKLIGDPDIVRGIAWETRGAGAGHLIVLNAKSEPQRRRNRRVEVRLFVQCATTPASRRGLAAAAAVHFLRAHMNSPDAAAIGVTCFEDAMPITCDVLFPEDITVEVEIGATEIRATISDAPKHQSLVGRPVCKYDFQCLADGSFRFFEKECLS